RAIQIAIREDMRMPANQLGGNAMHDLGKVEQRLLAAQLAVIDHLEQQVTQLTGQVGKITLFDGIGHLIGFFQGMRDDAREVLLQIPWAAMLRITQAGHQVQQVIQLVHDNSSMQRWAHQLLRLRRASMMLGSWLMRPSKRPRASRSGISMVSSMDAVLSSLLLRVFTASTLMRSLSSTWDTSRSSPERSKARITTSTG